MMHLRRCALAALFFLANFATLNATSLQVAPVLLDVPAPGAATKLVLKNRGSKKINAQIRIFKWIQKNGKDQLVRTNDVVASPPFATLSPKGVNIVRVIRVVKTPLKDEEAYRLIIDQLPTPGTPKGIGIKLQMRYSIPVFFGVEPNANPVLKWNIRHKDNSLLVKNSGKRHARISDLDIKSKSGQSLGSGKGLVGYVLSNSSAKFNIKSRKRWRKGSSVFLQANTRSKRLNISTRVQ